jgi:hypothetical protein
MFTYFVVLGSHFVYLEDPAIFSSPPSWFSPFYPRVLVYVHVSMNVFTGTSSFYYSLFFQESTARIIHRVFKLIFVLASQGEKSNFICSF